MVDDSIKYIIITLRNGCLGSCIDEERINVRNIDEVCCFRESSSLRTQIALIIPEKGLKYIFWNDMNTTSNFLYVLLLNLLYT